MIVAPHKIVSLTYEIWDAEGQLHERVDLPVQYVHGANSDLFEQIEQGLEGHAVGDVVDVTLTPDQAFGARRPELTHRDAIQNVPEEYRRVGAEAMFQNDQGETITMVVVGVENGQVVLDGNHPLAGKTVTFKVTITDIRDATPEEVAQGVPAGAPRLH